MTRRGTRLFFFVSTVASAAIFVGLTIDSHRQFPKLTHSAAIDASVIAGKNVWHRKNCINCHTLLGEGAYYAPDLTQITTQRGAPYLQEFLKDPSKFYSEERDGRLMPNLKLSDAEISNVIAFLAWVSRIDTQGWPPRPILVKGSAIPGANIGLLRPRPHRTIPRSSGARSSTGRPRGVPHAIRSPPA
jgi:nitric oxide reductase subunit C